MNKLFIKRKQSAIDIDLAFYGFLFILLLQPIQVFRSTFIHYEKGQIVAACLGI